MGYPASLLAHLRPTQNPFASSQYEPAVRFSLVVFNSTHSVSHKPLDYLLTSIPESDTIICNKSSKPVLRLKFKTRLILLTCKFATGHFYPDKIPQTDVDWLCHKI